MITSKIDLKIFIHKAIMLKNFKLHNASYNNILFSFILIKDFLLTYMKDVTFMTAIISYDGLSPSPIPNGYL